MCHLKNGSNHAVLHIKTTITQSVSNQLDAKRVAARVVFVHPHAVYQVLCRYQPVLANNANDINGCVHLAFATYDWNI